MPEIKRRNTLKTIGCTFAVAVVIGALMLALSLLVYPKNNQQAFGVTDEIANGVQGERENSLDVLFIGDSETYSAFSPLQMWEEHGFTSYVSATPAQQLPYSYTLLKRATQHQKPRVVVLETNSLYAPFTADAALLRTLQDAVPVLEYHDRWKNLMKGDFTAAVSTTYSDDMKGFYLDEEAKGVKPADASNYMTPTDRVEELPGLNAMYLQSMIDYCRSIGAEPVLVSTPSTVNWNYARHNGIQAFADKAGVRYLDLNVAPTKVDIDWNTETRDSGDHVNVAGAMKVSKFMGSYLAENYQLPDHRGDDAFSSWNESLGRYKQKINEG